ncbi:DUF192 domain-containing protein [Candidatus Daviesbacteria bacterium]|nr:DUF192 domain-containing protein [Candidatus Daviesbacteria bacterium]
MKKFIIQLVLLLLVIAAALVFYQAESSNKTIDIPFFPQAAKYANLKIGVTQVKVELIDTPSKRSKGLGGRSSLPENEGMLFIFDKADRHPFWMKGLSFPLDFVWIRENRIVDILTNIQPQPADIPDSSLPVYSANIAVDKVLELNSGAVQRLDIKIGDIIQLTPL